MNLAMTAAVAAVCGIGAGVLWFVYGRLRASVEARMDRYAEARCRHKYREWI